MVPKIAYTPRRASVMSATAHDDPRRWAQRGSCRVHRDVSRYSEVGASPVRMPSTGVATSRHPGAAQRTVRCNRLLGDGACYWTRRLLQVTSTPNIRAAARPAEKSVTRSPTGMPGRVRARATNIATHAAPMNHMLFLHRSRAPQGCSPNVGHSAAAQAPPAAMPSYAVRASASEGPGPARARGC